eukprot:367599-Prymnesium_polylepis.1
MHSRAPDTPSSTPARANACTVSTWRPLPPRLPPAQPAAPSSAAWRRSLQCLGVAAVLAPRAVKARAEPLHQPLATQPVKEEGVGERRLRTRGRAA